MQTSTNTLIGDALNRVDGPAKVTGTAEYAGDHRIEGGIAEGYIVEAPAGPGRITRLDTTAAERAEGVITVLTHRNAPAQKPYGTPEEEGRFTQSHAVLENDQVRHFGEPVALVIAGTLEQARHAASLVEIKIESTEGVYNPLDHRDKEEKPESVDGLDEVDTHDGDFDAAFSASDISVEASYFTGAQHSAAMEPHVTVAQWKNGKLTIHMAIQIIASAVSAFANTLGIDEENVRIISPFTGGGFGSKLGVHNEAILAALGAIACGRPVRVAQTRRNVFSNGPHRSRHLQELKLGASRDGKLKAIRHYSLAGMARNYPFAEAPASPTRASYAADAIHTIHRVVKADIPKVDSMRAPGEAIGTLTFETAIDELAEKCGIDPVEFRVLNEPEADPSSGDAFADRRLVECIRTGAEKFGWSGRVTPGSRRDGRKLIGQGMAVAIRPNTLNPSSAEVRLLPDGRLTARLDMTDIGTGTYTILTQIAAETLSIPADRITVELGDSSFPETSGSGGSFGAASSGSALFAACNSLKSALGERLAQAGVAANDFTIKGDRIAVGDRDIALADILDADGLSVEGSVDPDDYANGKAEYSYGVQFAEVEVDADTGELRVRRLLGVFDAGRILNIKTARSQLMGGMIFGIGGALLEETQMDDRYGSFMNRDFAEYHIAVNRDVPDLEVHMLDGFSEHSNPLGSKGIGELGICGAGPAIANAIYEATGVRVRKFPIHLEDVLDQLPAQ
ncbi:xanthine dehydrogenase family protein molybdopterin-binding subunit [Hoeflea ulvae]|uniref:Xanthine dehydrogenase family protein molybdopterin-binding subunit n=1 Tax=Hoeflea ulvae TaxID=2983764 RepID=A0ABT3YDK8_9HYPH|nr:xanthine dehydrogenase family protein molybdopterin-binding subunit [Hoeflea ulvae]MCY0093767.1 xanthine dehydrogenase family protein molybdopterin-binding subunit [Hoeflea ulvae]